MKASRQEQCLTIKLNQKMKKNIFISAALAVVAFSSCQQENLGGNGAELDGFRVHTEDMTKAVLDGVKVVFEDADAIDIYADAAETPAVYSYNKANDLFVATGTEAEGEEYTAIFPSTATNPSRSTIYISNRQVATVNSFPKSSMYMAGVSNSKEMTLKHLTGLWEIDLLPQYDGQKLVRASLEMNGGQKINGNFEVNWDDYSLTYVDGGNSAILLADISYVMTEGEPVKLFFALPAGKYEGGFTFTASMTDGTAMEVTSPSTINIERGQITKVKNDVAYRLFASGTGTETDPYVIKGANHWKNMVRKINTDATNYASAYYKIAADIDFENDPVTPIKNFSGVIDGGNYTLKNAKIGDGTASHQAFFYMLNGTVKNLKFDNITVTGGNATGAGSSAAVISAGNSSLAFTIDNCHVSNSTITSGPHAGDKGGSYAAGLVGRCNNDNAIINNCSVSTSTISCEVANVGGLVGFLNKGKLLNVVSVGNTISTKQNYAGGVVGNISTANVSNVQTNNNTITAGTYAGGLSGGLTSGVVDNVLSSGNTISTTSTRAGGVIGDMGGATIVNIVSKNNTVTVETQYCGGVVATCPSNDGKIINVLSVGNKLITTTHSYLPYLGLIIGTDGGENKPLVANNLVLSGTAEYTFESTDSAKPYAGCIGIIAGYISVTTENCFYNQNYRSRYDLKFTNAAKDDTNAKTSYRYAIGQKRNIITNTSWAGIDNGNTAYLATPLKDGTCLNALNEWVTDNFESYPTLKSWVSNPDDNGFPYLVLEDTATPSAEPLNVVESQY